VAVDEGALPGGERQQREHAADAVRHAVVGVSASKTVVRAARGPCVRPPAGQVLAVVGDRLGEAYAVVEYGEQGGGAGVAVQEVGAVAGQAANGVELRERWEESGVDAAVCGVNAAAHVVSHLSVESVKGALIGAGQVIGGACQSMREGGRPVEGVAVGAAGERFAGGGDEPVVGALPRSEAGGSPLDVQECDARQAIGKVLPMRDRWPNVRRVGVGELLGDGIYQVQRSLCGHGVLPVVRAVQARAAARAR
jgi:hypothetical protein